MLEANWAHAFTDPRVLEREQTMLTGVWTFLGLAHEVARDGDWIRASIGSRLVFVQRFGEDLRAFDNSCAHRFHPLRTKDRGNGPVVCPYHHWRYNREGVALGIPMCQEYFGVAPRELNARLVPVELATCGAFIFGRFTPPGGGETLEQFLGLAYPILEAMSATSHQARTVTKIVKANWKLCYHITLDDYHQVAVHPGTLGRHGYLPREHITYHRIGEHSAFFANPDPDGLAAMASACANQTQKATDFRIFHLFPNLLVSHHQCDPQFWYVCISRYSPTAVDRTHIRSWLYPSPFPVDRHWLRDRTAWWTEKFRPFMVEKAMQWIMRQDNSVCEKLQTHPPQRGTPAFFGAVETRIQWFEETYLARMATLNE